MARDIETREDLENLLTEFYAAAIADARIGYYFTHVTDLNLEKHLPIIASFWEKILFGSPVYSGNPMLVHHQLHQRAPFEKAHFDCWLEIFTTTVDRLFAGETANKDKDKAATIARAMFASLVEHADLKIHTSA